MGSKRFTNQICAYCSERKSVTGDHIFAREFFLPQHRDNLPQAPTCDYCNNEKSKLEHYLTTLLPFGGRHPYASENLLQQVPKRLVKNQRLARELNHGKSKVNLIENGQNAETIALPIREGTIESLFKLIIKGLAWHHWGVYLSHDFSVNVFVLTDFGRKFFQDKFFSANSANRVWASLGNGSVVYEGVQAGDNPQSMVWRFHLYGGVILCENSEIVSTEIGAISGSKKIMQKP